jgi:hypothetical protein
MPILLGNGDGTFKPAVSYAAGTNPASVAVGDFNCDGTPDLVVADAGSSFTNSSSVSVLLGHGDGTFAPAVNYAAGIHPVSVAVGDFNGDGLPDLAVLDGDSGVRVLLGNGDGSFQTSNVSYIPGRSSLRMALGDFNGDGFPDLAVSDASSNYVSILVNDGVWGGGPAPAGSHSRRPVLHSRSHGQADGPTFAEFAAPQPESALGIRLVSAERPAAHPPRVAPELALDQPGEANAIFSPFPIAWVRNARDAVFAEWRDPLVDVLAADSLR